jgi:competence protein ComEA
MEVVPPSAVAPVVTASERATKPDPNAQTETSPANWLWLNKLDQTFVTVFVAAFLVLVGYHWATLGGWGMQPIELDRLPSRQYDFRIDINSASWVEWTQIEGIGEVTANKIIADRDSNGPFRTIDDLLRVKGIGPKTLEKMRPFLRGPNEPATSE